MENRSKRLQRTVLAKARSALLAKQITGAEATRLEAGLHMGVVPERALLERIFGSAAELRKALANIDELRVTGCRPSDHFDELVANLAAWQRSRMRGR
ncbi:hypothetical protein [Paraburkholderia sp. A1RO-5L]|uniref:hypothetical protein n=1 Tax=unclassified Paraburkholderia TaxID=2615204 RepID=UPI003B768579